MPLRSVPKVFISETGSLRLRHGADLGAIRVIRGIRVRSVVVLVFWFVGLLVFLVFSVLLLQLQLHLVQSAIDAVGFVEQLAMSA
jgi:hypothetical protein